MKPTLTAVRRHELDWLRVFAVFILVFYHTGLIFNGWNWIIKNREINESYAYWIAFLHLWRMPLLFFISGAGTYFAFGKLSAPKFLVERFKRLLVPLLFGIILILPPQDYYQHIDEFDNFVIIDLCQAFVHACHQRLQFGFAFAEVGLA